MGGGGKPQAPTAPSTGQSVNDWVNALPNIFATQQEFAPKQAAQNLQLTQQFALPQAQALKAAQDALYPNTSALQEQLASQAAEGSQSQVPEWMRQQYQSNVNAQLGNNATSPIGADYISRGLLQQQQDWNRYYQQLGLQLTSRQPLVQPQAPQTTDFLSQFTPGSVMTSNNQNYGTQAGIYGSQLANQATQNAALYNMVGQFAGAAGTVAAHSSIRYKNRVKKWE